ncbi:MAG: DUF1073 domain-containing protein [bacterium]|nr:DUF1073 domain-containing protein [bacterium]
MDTPANDKTIEALDRMIRKYSSPFREDGFGNLATGLGVTGLDRGRASRVAPPQDVSEDDALNLYRGCGVAARAVDIPAQDMTRAGFEIVLRPTADKAEDFDNEEAQLVSDDTQDALESLRAIREIKRALRWEAQYGGAIVFVGIDDGKEPDQEVTDLTKILFVRAMHRYKVTVGPLVTDVQDPRFGKPESYVLVQTNGQEGITVHHSRVLEFPGLVDIDQDERATSNDGWSDSIYVRLWDSLRVFVESYGYAGVITQDFAQAVWKIKDLAIMLKAGKESEIQSRAQLMDIVASILNARLLDADGESWERQSTNVAGFPELLDRFGVRLAADWGGPLTLLLGQTPSGFSKEDVTGEANWDDVIAGWQEERLVPELEKLVGLMFRAKEGPTGGVEPDRWKVVPKPLTQMNEKDTADLRKTTAESDGIYVANDVLTPEEVAQSRFGGAMWSMETTLDLEARAEIAEAEEEMKNNPPPPPPVPPPSPFPPTDEPPPDLEEEEPDGEET